MAKRSTDSTRVISKIAELREATGITQQQLAVLIGVTTNTIQNWEKGKSGVDHIERFLKLCTVLDCELSDLIEYTDTNASTTKGFSLDELRELRKKWVAE